MGWGGREDSAFSAINVLHFWVLTLRRGWVMLNYVVLPCVAQGTLNSFDLGNKWHTEQQNHRIVKVGSDVWRSSGPTHLQEHGHLQPIVQDDVRCLFNISNETSETLRATYASAQSPWIHQKSVSCCSEGNSQFSVYAAFFRYRSKEPLLSLPSGIYRY